jgi:hypothetical protein
VPPGSPPRKPVRAVGDGPDRLAWPDAAPCRQSVATAQGWPVGGLRLGLRRHVEAPDRSARIRDPQVAVAE